MSGSKRNPDDGSAPTTELRTPDLDETQAVRGMARAIAEMRRKGVGWLEALIAVTIVIILLSAFLSGYFIFRELGRQSARDREARDQRVRLEKLATDAANASRDAKAALAALNAAIAKSPANIDELVRRFEESQKRQTNTIVRERTVVVYVTPSPQPTATVTCNPTPIVSQRPCGRP